MDSSGKKLSKATKAEAANTNNPAQTLIKALSFLGHYPPMEFESADTETILQWAIQNWDIKNILTKEEITP